MARVNVEENSWKRMARLAKVVGCSDREAVGACVMIWHESQELLKTHASKEDIQDWCELFNADDSEIDRWIHGMIRARIIDKTDQGYLIRGNELQIDARVSNSKRGTKGAEATRLRWQKINEEKGRHACVTHSESKAFSTDALENEGVTRPNARQCKAMQGTQEIDAPFSDDTKKKASKSGFDFESAYAFYPKKIGKGAGFKVLAKTIKTEDQYSNLVRAIQNYAKLCQVKGTGDDYILQFSTFVGPADAPRWVDYADINVTGTPKPQPRPFSPTDEKTF